jgi:hypothetical protein
MLTPLDEHHTAVAEARARPFIVVRCARSRFAVAGTLLKRPGTA